MERETSFDPADIKKLFKPEVTSRNGQVTIIGGSELFHGAPLLSLTTASRIAEMVYFASPDPSVGEVAANLKSRLFSFIWVPWDESDAYINKSDAILIGPGLMRFSKESDPAKADDEAWKETRTITKNLLEKFKDKRWVIDAGSLQVLDTASIPVGSILTPNVKEYKMLFGDMDPGRASSEFKCTIIVKGPIDKVCSDGKCIDVSGGNIGMAKGGMGDTLAGLTVALFAKNEANLSASCASYISKSAGDELFKSVGTNFNADDLANKVPGVLGRLQASTQKS